MKPITAFLAGAAAGIVATLAVSFLHHKNRPNSAITEKVVEVIVHDTISVPEPTCVALREVGTITIPNTIPIPTIIADTVKEYRDSLVYIEVPRQEKEYRDSTYYCRVSGYLPSLDYIETYGTTRTVTITTQKAAPRVSFGLQLGGGMVAPFGGSVGVGLYLGAGVCLRIGQ